ncbi:MAG: hypothetical protein ACKOXB_01355 [Flavobacteriales bacterium]
MRYTPVKIVLLFGIAFLFNACIKRKEFDIVPAITFQSYQVFTHVENGKNVADSAYLTFSFQDGDGDIGSGDDVSPSVFIDYYENKGGGFVRDTTVPQFKDYFPKLTPTGNNNGIEGTYLKVIRLQPPYNYKTSYPYQYKVLIKDRAGHESNTIETPSQSK